MKRLIYSPLSRADLFEISAYIARDNPDRAASFRLELEQKAALAAERPRSFPPRDDLGSGLRSILHRPYLILFRELRDQVRIERIVHGSRNLTRLSEL